MAAGEKALYETGKQFGAELMQQHMQRLNVSEDALTVEQKVQIAKEAFSTAGLSPAFELSADGTKFSMMYTIVHLKKLLFIIQLKFVTCTEI